MRVLRCAIWIVILGCISSIVAALQVLEQPKSSSVEEGQPLVLTCKLNAPANCSWYRNDVLTTISERYHFLSNNGINTKDCSFEIVNTMAKFDVAPWQCAALQGSSQPVYSDKVFLDVQRSMDPTHPGVRIVEQPENASVAYGHNHTLRCTFNEPVNCLWTRSSSAMKIGGRHRYLSNNGSNTKDCSFWITNFTHTDATYWQCTAMHGPGRIYTEEAVSDTIFLSIFDVPPIPLEIVVQPSNETVDPGQNHTLQCKFNTLVSCVWERNGTETTISDRYHYISNNGTRTRDCSVHISSFSTEFDAMVWQCKAFDTMRNRLVVSDAIFLAPQGNKHFSRSTLGLTELAVVEQPTNAIVNITDTFILKCHFSEPVHCDWMAPSNNNKFYYISNNGKQTTDCSIKITNFSSVDVGTWQCAAKGADGTRMVLSNNATLNTRNSTSIVPNSRHHMQLYAKQPLHGTSSIRVSVQPENATVIAGQDHLLSCVFDSPVNCVWHINEIPVVFDGGRYKYGDIYGGSNTANCSFLITKFNDLDVGYWECLGSIPNDQNQHGHSEKAFLSIVAPVRPNKTAILLNGNPVTEIWVPKNGSQNGTLQCVAEFAVPAAKLYWNNGSIINPNGSLGAQEICSESCYCNSTLTWFGDWKQLVNLTILKCTIVHLNSSNDVIAYLKFKNEPSGVSTGSLSAGAVAGIVIAVLLVVLLIVGALVYYFVLKPSTRGATPVGTVTMVPSKNKDGGHEIKLDLPSPSASEKSKANSTPGHSAETVRMNDRKPEAAPQSAVHVPLVKNVQGEAKPNNDAGDSSDESDGEKEKEWEKQKPGMNSRYSSPFTYIGGKDIFPVKKN